MDKRVAAVAIAAAVSGVATGVFLSSRPTMPSAAASAAYRPGADGHADFAMPPAETFAPVFEPCAHCHQVGPGARDASGPQLNGVVGRLAGSTGYPYSEAMKSSGLRWDDVTLAGFLANPAAVVPGTRMVFEGMTEPEARRVIRYLRSIDANQSGVAPPQAPD